MRYLFGLDGGSNVTDIYGNKLGRTCTIWSQRTGGAQITDLQSPTGVAYTGGVVSPQPNGSIGFLGPDADSAPKWADFGDAAEGGERWHIPLVTVAEVVAARVQLTAVPSSSLGQPSGTATLDVDGRVPYSQTPTQVLTDITAVDTKASTAATDAANAVTTADTAAAQVQSVVDQAVSQGGFATVPVSLAELGQDVLDSINSSGGGTGGLDTTTADARYLRLTGGTVTGPVVFNSAPTVPAESFAQSRIAGLVNALANIEALLTGPGSALVPLTDPAAARPPVFGSMSATWRVPSEPANAQPQDIIYLSGAPQLGALTVSSVAATSFTVSHAALSGVQYYQHERKLTSSSTWAVVGTSTTTSFVHTGLTAATSYDVRAAAVSDGGVGSPSPTVTQVTSAAAGAVYTQGFETDTGSWTNYQGNPTLTRDTAIKSAGTASLKVVATVASRTQPISPFFTVTPNTTYQVTLKIASVQAKTFIIQVEGYSSGAYRTSTFGGQVSVPAGTTGFTTLTTSLTTGADVNQMAIAPGVDTGIGQTVAVGDTWYIDEVTVA